MADGEDQNSHSANKDEDFNKQMLYVFDSEEIKHR